MTSPEALAARAILARRTRLARVAVAPQPRMARDVETWAGQRFYLPSTRQPMLLMPHQRAFLRLALTRNQQGDLPYRTIIYSTCKQSGKSTIAGLILRWYAETQGRGSELYTVGNDQEQARTRSFREISWSIEFTPGFSVSNGTLPGQWEVKRTIMRCVPTRSEIRAISIDAAGEAGGKPAMTCWTELWGFTSIEALRLWDELTPIPTIPDSLRIVETYAGYLGESTLLFSLYEQGRSGRQLSAGEMFRRTGVPHGPPFGAFTEAVHPDDPVPFWEDTTGSLLMYWDEGPAAHRMPWQLGPRGEEYYREQETSLKPNAYRRLHQNEWVSPEASFIHPDLWSACASNIGLPPPGDRTPMVLGVDAATTGDCFAVVAVSRKPGDPTGVSVRACRVFDPRESASGRVDYDEAERFIRLLVEGGCRLGHPRSRATSSCPACTDEPTIPGYNIVHVAYDPYQLEAPMGRLRAEGAVWVEAFSQQQDRLRADRALYDLILTRRLTHPSDARLTEHVLNAGVRLQQDQDSTMRLVKVSQTRKIDAAVALSMAAARCLYLNLPPVPL